MKFQPDALVKMKDTDGTWVYGRVTIPGVEKSKVLFDDYMLDYDYYPNDDLEPATEAEARTRGFT